MNNLKEKKPAPLFSVEKFEGEVNSPANEGNSNNLQTLVDSCLINLSERLQPPPIAMQIISDGKPITLFTKGNFSIITGAAKSRKSFLISMLIAAAIAGKLQDLFICGGNGMNILFDTEQSKYKVQQIAKRICHLSEKINPSNFLVYSLRTQDPAQRLEIIEYVLAKTPNINFVAIDGIIDLDNDPILQADQAQRIVQKLMQWSEMYNTHITCVLHYNKTVSTLVGHLGSFSHRKCDALIEVSKNKDDQNVSLVKAVDCREKEFLPFAFSVDQLGMPYMLNDYAIETAGKAAKEPKEKKPVLVYSLLSVVQHQDILQSVFKIHKQQGYEQCWRNIKNAIEIVTKLFAGDNKAKDFLTSYLAGGDIIKVEGKKAIYSLPGQIKIEY